MESIYRQIYKKAKPYWATRQNEIHVPISYGFARRLLVHYPGAVKAVVLPAILMHDLGWKMVPEEKQMNAFGPKGKDKKTQRFHELEGVRMATEILNSLHYDEKNTREIIEIIDGHDTRQEALSLNDKIVKDADKLWRFTSTGVRIDHIRFGIPVEEYIGWLGDRIEGWFFTPEAKRIARKELRKTITKLTKESSPVGCRTGRG